MNSRVELHADVEKSHEAAPKVPQFYDASEIERFGVPLNEYALTKELVLPHQPFHYNDISPTPLDAFHLKANGVPYFNGAEVYMEGDITNKRMSAGLPQEYADVIYREVMDQHGHRASKNMEAFERLVRNLKEPLSEYEAEVLMRIRAGVAAPHEPALLLGKVPEMGGVEAMKATRVLDQAAIENAELKFMQSLRHAEQYDSRLEINSLYTMKTTDTISIRDLRPRDEEGQIVPRELSLHDSVMVIKWVQADLSANGVAMEAVSRNSYIFLPLDVELRGVEPNYHTLPDGTVLNMQPIDITKYYRTKQSRVTSVEGIE